MVFIDSHCHLDFAVLQSDIEQVIARAQMNQVGAFVVPSVSAANFNSVIELARSNRNIYFALGLHPCFIEQHDIPDLVTLEQLLDCEDSCAVGEIGLDFLISNDTQNRAQQQRIFEAQIALATQYQLPVILHVRKAHDQVLQVLKKANFAYGGVVHAFNGSVVQAKRYTQEFGFKLGFGGTLTHPKALKIRALASSLPLTDIVLETDAPDMPLFNMKREYNEPANILDIAKVLSELRCESLDEIRDQILRNTKDCLNIT